MHDHDHPHHPGSSSRRQFLRDGLAASAVAAFVPGTLAEILRTPLPGDPGHLASRPHLEVAQKAARWLASSATKTERGTSWPVNPQKPDAVQTDLYSGTQGVVLFHLELYHATKDKDALATAMAGADHLAALTPNDSRIDAGLYSGLAGLAYTLETTHRASGEARFRDAAARTLSLIKESARPVGKGVEWSTSTDIISGSAGIGLFLLWAHQHLGDSSARDLAAKTGLALLERSQPDRGGLKWLVSPQMARNYPNFSHGTAGVSYFLASLHRATREQTFLDAARAGAIYLDALATSTPNGGRMVFHSEPGNEQIFYLSWCHGPAGTARLYRRLAEATGEKAYTARVGQLAQAIIDMRVPERSPGFWNNISQCCGNSGVVEFFLDLYRTTKEPRHLQFAEQVTADTVQRATADGDAMKWVQAENRVSPDDVLAQTGLMQGAAGVGIAMLHLDGVKEKRSPFVVLPDNPFTA
jgi:lantibiotic modifying enzyme